MEERALRGALASKVDRKDLERINQLKSNQLETDGLTDGINTLNKQMQHVISVVSETLRLGVVEGAKGTAARE